jgi:hypothetical protein
MNTSPLSIVVLSYEYIITLHCCVEFINMWHWGYKLKLEKKVVGICGWHNLHFGGIVDGGGFLVFWKMGVHGLWCNNGVRQLMHKCA